MDAEFTVDGTGNIVRPGDRVVVRAMNLSCSFGPGRLLKIHAESYAEVLCDGDSEPVAVSISTVMREDDTERVGGQPLWHYR